MELREWDICESLSSILSVQSPKGWRPPFLSSAASVHRTKSALLFVPIRKSALLFVPVTQSALLFDPVSSSDAFELFKMTRENIALRAEVRTLRECLGLFGRRRSGHRGGGGGYGGYGDYGRYERSASRSPPRDRYDDPFASQHF